MFNFTKLCRLCTNVKDVSFTLTDFDSDNITLSEKLNALAPEILESESELPNGVCITCIAHLNQAYKFKNNCLKSQETLKQLRNNKSTEIRQKLQENKNCQINIHNSATENTYSFELTDPEEIKKENNDDIDENYYRNINFVNVCVKSEKEFYYEGDENTYISSEINEFSSGNNTVIKTEKFVPQQTETRNEIYPESSKTIPNCQENEEFSKSNNNTPEIFQNDVCDSQSQNSKSFQCHICEKTFSGKSNLARHIRIHTEDKRYKCTICEKAFIQNYHLKMHLLTHTNEKAFICSICGKAFARNENLKAHILIHREDKSFKCELCGKAYSETGSLKTHMATHTRGTNFKCEICGKTFIGSGNSRRHQLLHTQEKYFKCDICGKAFNRNDNLKVHMRMHTPDNCLKCEICGKSFSRSDRFKLHMFIHV